eukprot:gene5898-6491_t
MTELVSDLHHHVFQLCLHRLDLSIKALELQESLGDDLSLTLPDLRPFYPNTVEDCEIQSFNLSLTIPPRLVDPEDVAMWLLEKDCLCRGHVGLLLSGPALSGGGGSVAGRGGSGTRSPSFLRETLSCLAKKIASLEAGQGFVEGLKFFLPVLGYHLQPSGDVAGGGGERLHFILQAYCLAHLTSSKRPFMSLGPEEADKLVEVAMAVIDLMKTLSQGGGGLSTSGGSGTGGGAVVMSTFFSSLRSLSLSLPMKVMTDLFVSTVSSLVQPLLIPHSRPSCLLGAILRREKVRLTTAFCDPWKICEACLTKDALYFLNHQQNTLLGCLPLQGILVQRVIQPYPQELVDEEQGVEVESDFIELINNGGGPLPWIDYTLQETAGKEGKSQGFFPSDLQLYPRLLLLLLTPTRASRRTNATTSESQESIFDENMRKEVEVWVDSIEEVVWNCRSVSRQALTFAVSAVVPSTTGVAPTVTATAGEGLQQRAQHKEEEKEKEEGAKQQQDILSLL